MVGQHDRLSPFADPCVPGFPGVFGAGRGHLDRVVGGERVRNRTAPRPGPRGTADAVPRRTDRAASGEASGSDRTVGAAPGRTDADPAHRPGDPGGRLWSDCTPWWPWTGWKTTIWSPTPSSG